MDHLDILQKELDKVLEQVGTVLAANNEKSTAAAATKLKHVLPGAQATFHEALDSLSEEINFARLVIQRDLAVGALPKPEEKAQTPVPAPIKAASPSPIPDAKPSGEDAKSPPAQKPESPAPAAPASPKPPQDQAKADEKPIPSPGKDNPPDEKPPTTAPSPTAEQNPPTNQSSAENTVDNDNISALLPGLQDYAKGPADDAGADTGDFDFEMFGADPGGNDAGGVGEGDAGITDFADFDFEAEFGLAGAGGGGGGGGDLGGDDDVFGGLDVGGGGNDGDGNGQGGTLNDEDMDFFKFD